MKKEKWKRILGIIGIIGCIILCVAILTPSVEKFVQKQESNAQKQEANEFFKKNCEAIEKKYHVEYKECDIYVKHKMAEANEDAIVLKTITFDAKKKLGRKKILNLCMDISNLSKSPFVIDTQTANRTIFVVGDDKYMLSNNTDINKGTNLNTYYILIQGGKEIGNNYDSLQESEREEIKAYKEKIEKDEEKRRKAEIERKEKEKKTKKLMEKSSKKEKSPKTESMVSDNEESKDIILDGFNLIDGYDGTKGTLEYGYAEITGTVKNETGVSWNYVEIDFDIYNSADEKVGIAMDNILGLDANESWKFKAMCACDESKYYYELREIKYY